jgi:hypothetical protein
MSASFFIRKVCSASVEPAHSLTRLSRHAKGPSVKVVTKEQFNGRPGRAPICSERFDHDNQPIGLKSATNGEVLG